MAWYAYCITEQQAFQGTTRTRAHFPLKVSKASAMPRLLAIPAGFAVIVSEYIPVGELGQKALLQHAHVVSECFKHTTVLSFRFGTVFDSEMPCAGPSALNRKGFLEASASSKARPRCI